MEYLYLAATAFTAWMLIDAYRRQVDHTWFYIVLFFPVAGPLAYFFTVKLTDWPGIRVGPFGSGQASLDELRYRAEQTPTLTSHLELAEGLMERGHHDEAIPHLEAAQRWEPEHSQVLYNLAVCYTEQGHPEKASPLLDQIIARDRAWSDYAAWRLLATAKAQAGDSAAALATCRALERLAPTLENRCLLVERLLAEGMADEARLLLEESLEAHRYAPMAIRRRNRRWAGHARRLRKRIRVATRA
jgi:hypothetical protein